MIVSGFAFPRGNPFDVIELWRAGAFQLVTSDQQLTELSVVLNRPNLSRYVDPADARLIVQMLGQRADLVVIGTVERRVRDPDDDIILATALDGMAEFLITGDKDLLVLATSSDIGSLRILTPLDLLTQMKSRLDFD